MYQHIYPRIRPSSVWRNHKKKKSCFSACVHRKLFFTVPDVEALKDLFFLEFLSLNLLGFSPWWLFFLSASHMVRNCNVATRTACVLASCLFSGLSTAVEIGLVWILVLSLAVFLFVFLFLFSSKVLMGFYAESTMMHIQNGQCVDIKLLVCDTVP